MPNASIVNPTGAFSEPFTPQTVQGQQNLLVELAAAVAIGQTVSINTSGLGIVGTATNHPVGIALEAGAIGQVIQVATSGSIVQAIAGSGGVTANAVAAPAAAGQITTASATIGGNIGIVLTTQATQGDFFTLFVQVM